MEPWYESHNNSRELQHLSSIKKYKQAVLTPNRCSNSARKRRKNDVLTHKSRENSLHFCNKYYINGYNNVCTVIFI